MIRIIKPDFRFDDARGSLIQLLGSGCMQVNSVYTVKGAVRGRNHYHRFNEETFFIVSGSVHVRVSLDGISEEYDFSSGDMFCIEKFVRHDITFNEDTYMVVMYDRGVELEDGTKDIIEDSD